MVSKIACWDAAVSLWKPLQNGLSGPVYSLRSYPDGLYAAGWFEYANDTLEVNGLARWDGSTWHKVHDLPKLNPNDINRINDLAYYQGELYIGGNFGGTNGRLDIAKWDGTAWVDVDGGFLGVFSTVNKFAVHDGLLYIAGSFANYPPYGHPDNPGSGIVTWDGSTWDDLAGGTSGSSNATVTRMVWLHDTLHVVGLFGRIGGVPTGRIARWDGQRWCSLVPPDYFYPDIGPIGVFRDTLYVGGSFTVAGPDSINRVAKWVAGGYVDSCQVIVGVGPEHEDPQGTGGLSLHPNPADEVVALSQGGRPLPGVAYVVHDALGRLVGSGRTDVVSTLDVRYLVPGAYAVTVLNGQGGVLGQGRMIKH
ncbi:MAG TPA: T9SS type A sorting domain-containing protein [Flavobacteriales bacterium]|nr:T9SS type A sorting domain-containing protein [Flavobacteriales bacterium]HMR26677.1 T9SS type A sorting domain-containing protein [Flavobacteriales bacterium]